MLLLINTNIIIILILIAFIIILIIGIFVLHKQESSSFQYEDFTNEKFAVRHVILYLDSENLSKYDKARIKVRAYNHILYNKEFRRYLNAYPEKRIILLNKIYEQNKIIKKNDI